MTTIRRYPRTYIFGFALLALVAASFISLFADWYYWIPTQEMGAQYFNAFSDASRTQMFPRDPDGVAIGLLFSFLLFCSAITTFVAVKTHLLAAASFFAALNVFWLGLSFWLCQTWLGSDRWITPQSGYFVFMALIQIAFVVNGLFLFFRERDR